MIPLGLTAATQSGLNEALATDHSVHVTVAVLNLSGAKLADASWRLLDGQVNIDADAAITRSATLSLLDPNRTMAFDSDSPNDGALYLDRMIQINYSVKGGALADWVTIPLFTGPVVDMERADDVINVECQGKELLAMGAVWKPRTYPKGWRKRDVIMSILQTRAGETKFSFPEYTALLPNDYAIGRENTAWGVAQHLAQSMGLQLFYDGRGTARLRARPQASTWRFRTGDGGTVTTPPRIKYSAQNVKNTVWVRGATSTATSGTFGTLPIGAVANAPANHPLSAARLGRNGYPRYLLEVYQNSSITTTSEAQRFADSILAARLLESVDVSFDCMPIPHLDPMDVARVDTEQYSNAFRFTRGSIPLVVGDSSGSPRSMSVGYLNKISLKPRRGR